MANAEESSQTLTVLFTHGLHDNFLPVELVQNGKKQYIGGYARLFSAIQRVRAQEQNVVLVDGGDYSISLVVYGIVLLVAGLAVFIVVKIVKRRRK